MDELGQSTPQAPRRAKPFTRNVLDAYLPDTRAEPSHAHGCSPLEAVGLPSRSSACGDGASAGLLLFRSSDRRPGGRRAMKWWRGRYTRTRALVARRPPQCVYELRRPVSPRADESFRAAPHLTVTGRGVRRLTVVAPSLVAPNAALQRRRSSSSTLEPAASTYRPTNVRADLRRPASRGSTRGPFFVPQRKAFVSLNGARAHRTAPRRLPSCTNRFTVRCAGLFVKEAVVDERGPKRAGVAKLDC